MRRWFWLAWLALVAGSVLQIVRTEVVTDVTSFLPGAANADQRLMADQLRNGLSTRILLVALRLEGGADPGKQTSEQSAALTKASRELQSKLAVLPAFAWVSNGDFSAHEKERERMFDARYLLTAAGQDSGAARFSTPELAAAFARLERELISSRGVVIRPIAASDPTLESLKLLDRSTGLIAPMAGNGVWMSADGRSAILLMETAAQGYEIAKLRDSITLAQQHAAEVLGQWPATLGRPVVELAGAAYFIVKSHDTLGTDAERLPLPALVLVAGLLLWSLRSGRFVCLAMIPVASGVLAGFAAVGFVYGHVHGITLAFGVTLIGEAVDYAIYTFVQRDEAGSHAPRFWRQLWLAVATSLIGFTAMFFSGFQGLQQLGVFSIAGLLAAAVCTRWLLPPLLPRVHQGYAGVRWSEFAWLPALTAHMTRLRWPLLIAAIAMLAYLHRHNDTMWHDGLESISAASPGESARDLRYRNDIGVPDLRTMVVARGANLDEALSRAETAGRLLDTLVRGGLLAGYDSPSSLLPSIAVQKRRQAVLPKENLLRERIGEALAGGNFRVQAFEPFTAEVAAAKTRAPIDRAYYGKTIIGRWLDAQIVQNDDGIAVLILLRGVTSRTALDAAMKSARLPGVTHLDLQRDVDTLVAGYRLQTLDTALIGAVGIALLLALQLRKKRAVFAMLASLSCTVVVTAWMVLVLAGHLTIFNLVALLLVAGVASNYTLFFSTLSAHAAQRRRASLSVLLAGASTFSAFAMLTLSSSPVLAAIGLTVSLGVVVGLIASMAFAPRLPAQP